MSGLRSNFMASVKPVVAHGYNCDNERRCGRMSKTEGDGVDIVVFDHVKHHIIWVYARVSEWVRGTGWTRWVFISESIWELISERVWVSKCMPQKMKVSERVIVHASPSGSKGNLINASVDQTYMLIHTYIFICDVKPVLISSCCFWFVFLRNASVLES